MYFYWIISYLIGNILSAWWVGIWKRTDLRTMRSGNLGARNAGAVLGKAAFFLTFLGDSLKGALIVYIGFHYNFDLWIIATGGLCVILGHLYPFWLKFKGGKGIATFIGVTLLFNPPLFGWIAACFIIFIAILRSATLSMFIAFSIYAILIGYYFEVYHSWPLLLAIFIILLRHRLDLLESWNERWWRKKV